MHYFVLLDCILVSISNIDQILKETMQVFRLKTHYRFISVTTMGWEMGGDYISLFYLEQIICPCHNPDAVSVNILVKLAHGVMGRDQQWFR